MTVEEQYLYESTDNRVLRPQKGGAGDGDDDLFKKSGASEPFTAHSTLYSTDNETTAKQVDPFQDPFGVSSCPEFSAAAQAAPAAAAAPPPAAVPENSTAQFFADLVKPQPAAAPAPRPKKAAMGRAKGTAALARKTKSGTKARAQPTRENKDGVLLEV